METLEFTSSIETAAESDEELSMPPSKKLAVCNTSDTEVYPSVSPRLKKSFNCQNILQPTTVRYIEPFSSNHSIPISSSSDQSLATVVAALGTRFSAFEKKSLELLVSIQYDLKKLNTRLINLEKSLVFPFTVSNQSIAGPSPSAQWNYLPVKEEKELLDLDEKLQNKDTYESLMNFLASVGGDDYKQLTTAILKQLLTKKVCLLYSLYGRKQKKSFSSLTSCKVVIAAIKKKFENANDKSIKERIGSFLATAIDRDGGRKNRTAIEQSPLLSDENECREDNAHYLIVNQCPLSDIKIFIHDERIITSSSIVSKVDWNKRLTSSTT
ncbi:uncharacterized protein LOC136082279 isoform X2 [Hydra vulgaris]|uniref:uncharacterized protein LOC136082279 isoform X2 n=1 Tax=Hydra vulgaris TaxID=6087 RepID=UPI0032EA72CD